MDGILIVDKPKNYTSHDIVYKIKKKLNEKVGHTGTLDPMATGVLPLLIGKGTLASKYLINHDKIYEVELELGKRTDTADVEGNIIEKKEVNKNIFEKENIENILKTFLGKQKQTPPIYSAIKVNGKKLYEYARKGQKVEIKQRDIEIYNIELIKLNYDEKKIFFKVSCSKGTYIRSLCEDIAVKLGNIGYMSNLRRIKVGEFSISDATEIEKILNDLDENKEKCISEKFISLEKLFWKSKDIILNNKATELILNGVKITRDLEDGIYKLYKEIENEKETKKFIGIGIIKDNLLKRDIIV